MRSKKIITKAGHRVKIDTSEQACLEFGFRAGDLVIFRKEKGVVEGVSDQGCIGCKNNSECDNPVKYEKVIYITFENDSGATFLRKENCAELKKTS